jgi:putative spermidine/putrescine transport system permease protein
LLTLGGIWAALLPAVLFLAAFFVAPLVDNGSRSFFAPDGRFSLEHYTTLALDPYYLGVLGQTLGLSLVVTLICLVIGYPVAYYLVRRARGSAALIIFLLISPLLTSIVMRTYGWRVLLARRGLINIMLLDLGIIERPLDFLNVPTAAVVGLVHVLVPFMVLSIATVLQGIDRRLEEAAEMLGATPFQVFRRITFPLSLDGVGTGSILVFMVATGSFVTLLFLGGGTVQTLPLLIYQQFNTTRNFGLAAAMSTALLAIAVACLYLQLRLIRRRGVL